MTTTEVQSGLEGVVAFATEIAEPDKEGGALRYRGVDIEDLVGVVPYEKVWGLLVDNEFNPGLPPAEHHLDQRSEVRGRHVGGWIGRQVRSSGDPREDQAERQPERDRERTVGVGPVAHHDPVLTESPTHEADHRVVRLARDDRALHRLKVALCPRGTRIGQAHRVVVRGVLGELDAPLAVDRFQRAPQELVVRRRPTEHQGASVEAATPARGPQGIG